MEINEFQARDLKLGKGLKRLSEDLNDALEDGIDEDGKAELLQRAAEKLQEYDAFMAELQPASQEVINRDHGRYIDNVRQRAARLKDGV